MAQSIIVPERDGRVLSGSYLEQRAMAAEKTKPSRLIKRYAGNRLYDPETGTYLTPDDISRLELEGYKVAVRDAETGQYVTEEVLLASASH